MIQLEVGKFYEVRNPYKVNAITRDKVTVVRIISIMYPNLYKGHNGTIYNAGGTCFRFFHPRFDLVKEVHNG